MRVRQALATAAIEAVTAYLQGCGFRILDREWACPDGEIAIVAADRQVLVACEVRVRAGTRYQTPLEAISPARKRQLRAATAAWMTAHGIRADQIRVDIAGLLQDGSGGFTIEHIRGVA